MLDIDNIPLDDKKTWNLICSGRTKGAFQIESSLGKSWCQKLKPHNIEELAALISIIRPGCANVILDGKSLTQHYCDRKNKKEEVKYLYPCLESILKETYGILVYQEEAIQIAQKIAGFDLKQADSLRKSIGKKLPELMAKVEKEFLEGCQTTNIVTLEEAKKIFNWIRESQKYSFNKSHAISYAINSYISAYCKANYPLQFFCAYLRGAQWEQDPLQELNELITDARQFGYIVYVPDFRSNETTFHIYDNNLRFGIGDIKNIGKAALSKIQSAKAECEIKLCKKSKDWIWLNYLLQFSDNISSTANIALISCGSLDYLRKSRNEMLFEYELYSKLTEKERTCAKTLDNVNNFGEILQSIIVNKGCTKKRITTIESLKRSLDNPPHSLEDNAEWLSWTEKKYLGYALTCNRVDGCTNGIQANTTCAEVINRNLKENIVLAVEITTSKEITIKNGKLAGMQMAFIAVTDSSGTLDNIICFPTQWENYKLYLFNSNTVLLSLEKSRNKNSFVIKTVSQI